MKTPTDPNKPGSLQKSRGKETIQVITLHQEAAHSESLFVLICATHTCKHTPIISILHVYHCTH